MSSLPINLKDWKIENIITYLEKQKDKSFVEENNVHKKLEQPKINGASFLLLTEELLSRNLHIYDFSHGIALEIVKTIGKLNKDDNLFALLVVFVVIMVVGMLLPEDDDVELPVVKAVVEPADAASPQNCWTAG
ncbi:12475_t:CDS:2 [Entrophospora sp. SA101]|nr:6017_t:CDS:2 [Entrophospora sp. SA101]CAJ0827281.1 12475_t:CDS:2 [Entrophospora sp. SA101]CAJ0925984.1 13392_t:CDS:2 [Entrophospora sp. SA101]